MSGARFRGCWVVEDYKSGNPVPNFCTDRGLAVLEIMQMFQSATVRPYYLLEIAGSRILGDDPPPCALTTFCLGGKSPIGHEGFSGSPVSTLPVRFARSKVVSRGGFFGSLIDSEAIFPSA